MDASNSNTNFINDRNESICAALKTAFTVSVTYIYAWTSNKSSSMCWSNSTHVNLQRAQILPKYLKAFYEGHFMVS